MLSNSFTNTTVSLFPNLTKKYTKQSTDLTTVFNWIKGGEHKELIDAARLFPKKSLPYEALKAAIPTWTPNSTFRTSRELKNINQLTGFIYIDFDNQDLSKEDFKKYNFIYAMWKSVSNIGFGGIIPVNNLTVKNFKSTWSYLYDIFKADGLLLDEQTNDITRQNVISFDPDLYINENCQAINAVEPNESEAIFVNPIKNGKALKPKKKKVSIEEAIQEIDFSTYFDEPEPIKPLDEHTKLIFKKILSDYQDKEYIVIKEGLEKMDVYVPKKIPVGKRHPFFFQFVIRIIYNNPGVNKAEILNIANVINNDKTKCESPLSEQELMNIINHTYNRYLNNQLFFKTELKKIWFNPDSNLTVKQKQSIAGKETGKLRKERTLSELQLIYDELKGYYPVVSKKLLADNSTKSRKTVGRYWDNIKN